MDIAYLINHPENLNKETLYSLRSFLALYPYYQPARLLLLQNLFLLHDPTFDEELRRASAYITDRRVLFNLVEAAHYQLRPQNKQEAKQQNTPPAEPLPNNESNEKPEKISDRTTSLIDNFLGQIPQNEPKNEEQHRKPTPVDATVDYVAYLLETENKQEQTTPELKGQNLIDNFIIKEGGKMTLQEETEYDPETKETTEETENSNSGYFTETLARIYIKQGRYSKALEIIQRLNLEHPKKNRYFADQIRFLKKLIINNNKK